MVTILPIGYYPPHSQSKVCDLFSIHPLPRSVSTDFFLDRIRRFIDQITSIESVPKMQIGT
jgi:hypothetical protein